MMPGYFKIISVLLSHLFLYFIFMCKIRVIAPPMACPYHLHSIWGHHRYLRRVQVKITTRPELSTKVYESYLCYVLWIAVFQWILLTSIKQHMLCRQASQNIWWSNPIFKSTNKYINKVEWNGWHVMHNYLLKIRTSSLNLNNDAEPKLCQGFIWLVAVLAI